MKYLYDFLINEGIYFIEKIPSARGGPPTAKRGQVHSVPPPLGTSL